MECPALSVAYRPRGALVCSRSVAQHRHHYESAFEQYVRRRSIPYVSVNEARRALFKETPSFHCRAGTEPRPRPLKSFDFVLYGTPTNLLVEVKGRQVTGGGSNARARLENWVTEQDVESLLIWERLFGEGFKAAFAFVYWCAEPPPEPLFEEIFEFRDRWYALRGVEVAAYAREVRPRSAKWRTVHVPHAAFDRISGPLGRISEPSCA